QLLKNHRGDLRRAVDLPLNFDVGVAVGRLHHLVRQPLHRLFHFGRVELPPHQPFNRIDCVRRIGDRLPSCDLPHQPLSFVGDGDDGRGRSIPFRVGNHLRVSPGHDRHAREGRSKINSDYLCHFFLLYPHHSIFRLGPSLHPRGTFSSIPTPKKDAERVHSRNTLFESLQPHGPLFHPSPLPTPPAQSTDGERDRTADEGCQSGERRTSPTLKGAASE